MAILRSFERHRGDFFHCLLRIRRGSRSAVVDAASVFVDAGQDEIRIDRFCEKWMSSDLRLHPVGRVLRHQRCQEDYGRVTEQRIRFHFGGYRAAVGIRHDNVEKDDVRPEVAGGGNCAAPRIFRRAPGNCRVRRGTLRGLE